MRKFFLPFWLQPGQPGANAFVALFLLESVVRTIPIATVPLLAHALLGDAQRVSVLYFACSVGGLLGSLAIPWLIHVIRRRWVFTLGAGLLVAAACLYATATPAALAVGLLAQVLGTAITEITLNLYVLDHVERREIQRFEPKRVFFAAGAWAVGPWLGVTLNAEVAPWAAYALAGAIVLVMLGLFWYLRLTDSPALPIGRGGPPNPLKYLARFFAQPRLRLAWFLAAGRAGWWGMFFVFAPIYAVTAGLGPQAGGTLVSLGGACLFLVPLWARIAGHFGMRVLLIGGYSGVGVFTVAAALAAFTEAPWLAAGLLVAGALSASSIDGVGNATFLRAVRPLERPEMTTVFSTFRHTSQIVPPGVFAILLKVFALPSVFVAAAAMMAVLARYAGYIPRKM